MNMRFGKYELLDTLKHRGPFVTRRGRDSESGAAVILKTMHRDQVRRELTETLQHEFDMMQQLASGSVIAARDLVWEDDVPALVMADPKGDLLTTYLRESQTSLIKSMRLAILVAQALDRLHAAGVIYGDLNPQNIMISPDRAKVVLMDLAHAERSGLRKRSNGSLPGAADYTAPEATGRLSRAADHRADLYAFGVLLFEMLTGRLPFDGGDLRQRVYAHMALPPPLLSKHVPTAPDVLVRLCDRLLAKQPEQRYQTAHGLLHDLEYCLTRIEGAPAAADFELGAADIPRKLTLSTTLQGRGTQMELLRRRFERVREGRAATYPIEIAGKPGVGKSTLVESMRRFVERSEGLFVTARLDAIDPMGGLMQAARDLSELLLTERYGSPEAWRRWLEDGMRDTLPVLADILPAFKALVGDVPSPPPLGPRETAERTSLAIRRFFRASARPEHPLVLVVEDTHLANAATLGFLTSLARSQENERLLLIHTRRVAPDAAEVDLPANDRIILDDLDADAIATLLAETFRAETAQVLPLAQIIIDKVGGAPLAVGQFIGVLVDDEALRFDDETGQWVWDAGAIRAQQVGENVVELLLSRGAGLSDEERDIIGAMACLGERFGYADAEIAAGGEDRLSKGLERATAMGWLQPESDGGLSNDVPALRFAHERIWSAALSMLDVEAQRAIHARMFEALMAEADPLPQGDALYEAARHAHAALPSDATPEMTAPARGLCAAAGGQALGMNELQRGHRFFQMAVGLLSEDDWTTDPGAALELTAGAGGAAMLALAFDEADLRLGTFLERCPDPVGRAGIQALRNVNQVALNKARVALTDGFAALRELGVDLPEDPGPEDIGAAAGGVFEALGGRSVGSLKDLPDASDPKAIAIQGLLAATCYPAFSANPMAFAVLSATLVDYSIRDGITEHSAAGFVDFALTACGPMNQVEIGYDFGQLSLAMVEAKNLAQFKPRVNSVFEGFIRHRKEPIRQTLPGLMRFREESIALGDPMMAGLAAFVNGFQRYWVGERIDYAVTAFEEAQLLCDDLNLGLYPDIVAVHLQALQCLNGQAEDPTVLKGAFCDAEKLLPVFHERNDFNGISHVHVAQMLLALVAGDRAGAAAIGRTCHPFLPGLISTAALPHFYMIFALAVGVEAEEDQITPEDRAILEEGAALTGYWAEQSPDNYTQLRLILEAELALIDRQDQTWRDKMEAAAEEATRVGFTRNAAMILERIAMVSKARNRPRSHAHFIQDAWRAWIHYGAEAKVEAMAKANLSELQRLLPVAGAQEKASLPTPVLSEQLDLDALLDATRAISREVRVSDLLKALLSGVVEIAGANTAMVAAPEGEGYRVMARMEITEDGPNIVSTDDPESAPLCTPEMAPLSAFRLVARLGQALSTSDVTSDARLAGDPFFSSDVPSSLAVVPLSKGPDLIGLIYLENRDVTDAFEGLRMNLLNALCAQAAISWDNARLYDRQARLLAAADRFVPGELARLFHRDSIVDVEMSDARFNRMTIMVSDLRGSTTSAEHLGPQQTFARVNAFLAAFSAVAHDYGGVVLKYTGDGVLALFPGGTQTAIDAAIDIQRRLEGSDLAGEAGKSAVAGIAIHSGEIMFGVIGDGSRMQIDALSDAVNVTFRLEALTKRFGSRVLVSEDALSDLEDKDAVMHRLRFLGRVETRGRVARTAVFEVIEAEPEGLRDAKLSTLHEFEAGVRLFDGADFVQACESFGNVLRENPGDTAASGLFQEASRQIGKIGHA